MKSRIKYLLFTAIVFIFTSNVFSQVPSYVPTSGLVGYWPFNGNANDESGNGNNGTVNGATLTTDRFGSANSAYSFNGNGNHIEIPNSPSLNPSQISFSFWGFFNSGNCGILDKVDQSSPENYGYSLIHNFLNQNGFFSGWNTTGQCNWPDLTGYTFGPNGIIANSNWVNVTVTIDVSGLCKQYVNGQLSHTYSWLPLNTCSSINSKLFIGRQWLGDPCWMNGKLDDIGIWNRALSPTEITQLYTGTPVTTPVACSPFLGEDQTVCAGKGFTINDCANVGGSMGGVAAYNVSTIPFAPDPLTAGVQVTLGDDALSGDLDIGFSFCYYGNTYTQFNIGSNNFISFPPNTNATYITTAIPNAGAVPQNAIMAPWQDILPGLGGTVKYQLYGTAPFRRMSVSWYEIPMFICTGQLYTGQIIIYETTNVIETHILNKSVCAGWNFGNAVHGLHNIGGTAAIVVNNRNNNQWTATNEGTRFMPGALGIEWASTTGVTYPYNNGVLTVAAVQVLQGTTGYFLRSACGGNLISDTSWITQVSPSVSLVAQTDICSQGIGSITATPGVESPGPYTYSWTPSPTVPLSNPVGNINLFGGTYSLTQVDGNNCSSTATIVVGDNQGGCSSNDSIDVTLIDATITASDSIICAGQPSILTASSGTSTTSNFSIGSIGPSGGYVFYDQGSVINGWRYLEASPNDNGSNEGTGCYCTSISNTSNLIGTGQTNTSNWISSGCNGYWFNLTQTLSINGLTNWFIPSKDELNIMYTNLKINNLGNFQNVAYWSSTPAGYGSCGINGGAWVQNFTNGNQYSEYRNGYQGAGNLRLVRQFAAGTPLSTYLWSTGATTATISVTPSSTTTYICTVTTNGVSCTDSVTVVVNNPTIDFGSDVTACGTATTLTAPTGYDSYTWSNGSTTNTTTVTANGTYSCTVTQGGCSANDSIDVTLIDVTITASDSIICVGETVTLSVPTATTSSRTLVAQYTLSFGGPFNYVLPTEIGEVYEIEISGVYAVHCDNWGQMDAAFVFNQGPAEANPSFMVWNGSTIRPTPNVYNPTHNYIYTNLVATNATQNFGFTDSPYYDNCGSLNLNIYKISNGLLGSHLWSTGATTASINVTPTQTTTYTCTVTDANESACTDSVTVVVNNLTIDLGSDITACGTSTTLTAPTGFDSYLWSNGAITNTTTVSAIGTYTCTVTQGLCSATDSIDVTLIDATITASDSVICIGESVTLSVDGNILNTGNLIVSSVDGNISNAGNLIVSSNETFYTDNVRTQISAASSAGQASVYVAQATGLLPNDRVLLIVMQGLASNSSSQPEVGNYEFATIQSINGNQLTFTQALQHSYYEPSLTKCQLIRVPTYENVTVSGTLTCNPWDGLTGGVLCFFANGQITINANGSINADGKGFRGGQSVSSWGGGYQGESYYGLGTRWFESNNGGGGGGNAEWCSSGQGGGGGGYVVASDTAPSPCFSCGGGWTFGSCSNSGYGGNAVSLGTDKIILGSGGGSGGVDGDNPDWGGFGGNGGGIIFIKANQLSGVGMISSKGLTGNDSPGETGGGGGGSGGLIIIESTNPNPFDGSVPGGNGGKLYDQRRGGKGSNGIYRELNELGQIWNNVVWSNGETTPTISVSPTTTTTYTSTVTINGVSYTDSYTIQVVNPAFSLGGIVTTCGNDPYIVTAPAGYDSYSWSNGSTESSTSVQQENNVSCTVTLQGCTATNSIQIEHLEVDVTSNATTICAGQSASLSVVTNAGVINPIGESLFNGQAYIEFPPTNLYGTTPRTISYRIKTSAQNTMSMLSYGGSNDGPGLLDLCTNLNLGFGAASGYCSNINQGISFFSNSHSVTFGKPITDNQWHTVTYVLGENNDFSFASMKAYVDGLLVSQGQNNIPFCGHNWGGWQHNTVNGPLFIGKPSIYNPYSSKYNGGLKEIGMWSRALSSSEVLQLNSSFPNSITNGLAHYFPLTTDTAIDVITGDIGQINGNTPYQILWSNGATTATIDVSPQTTTTYYCTITSNGVSCSDSVTVVVNNPPFDLGNDVNVCGPSTTLTAPSGYDSYLWSNGATTNTTTVTANGTYTCTVTQGGCSASDTIEVTLIDVTITASDSIICVGETTTLSISGINSTATTSSCSALPSNLQAGLVGYWPFCGNANDESGNGNNGVVYGATLTTDRFGSANSAYSFDGVVDEVICTNDTSVQITVGTISAWFNANNGNLGINGIIAKQNAWGLFVWDNTLRAYDWGNAVDRNTGITVGNNTWHYVAMTFTETVGTPSNNAIIYLNGSAVLTTTVKHSNHLETVQVGEANAAQNFGGKIDQVSIYNRVLTAAEIQQLFTFGQTTYSWSNGATTPTINVSPNQTTTYTCTVTTNGVSCTSNYTITVNNSSASTNIVNAFDSFTWLDGNTYTSSNNTATYTTTNAAGCDSVISLNLTITPSSPTLSLQVFLDGYYTNSSNSSSMRPARYNNLVASGSSTPGAATDVDVITVELRSPSSLDVVAYSVSPILQTNGSVQCVFPEGALGGSFYIVVKHRAAIPLWSANPILISYGSAYSFVNNQASSYTDGDPVYPSMHHLIPGPLYGMWMGELNYDSYLDGNDYPLFEVDVNSSSYVGLYLLNGDLNGDTYVDASDYSVFDYNTTIGSYEQRPYATTNNVSIGQSYQGGIVAYVFQPGDFGYDPLLPHGIIVANQDLPVKYTWGPWNPTQYSQSFQNISNDIGRGKLNTDAILTLGVNLNLNFPAAHMAKNYTDGVYNDWFLPSLNDLIAIKNNLAINNLGNFDITSVTAGDLSTGYWSSSVMENYVGAMAPLFVLNSTVVCGCAVFETYYVRPVRYF